MCHFHVIYAAREPRTVYKCHAMRNGKYPHCLVSWSGVGKPSDPIGLAEAKFVSCEIRSLAQRRTEDASESEATNLLDNSELEYRISLLSHAIFHRGRIVDAFV